MYRPSSISFYRAELGKVMQKGRLSSNGTFGIRLESRFVPNGQSSIVSLRGIIIYDILKVKVVFRAGQHSLSVSVSPD